MTTVISPAERLHHALNELDEFKTETRERQKRYTNALKAAATTDGKLRSALAELLENISGVEGVKFYRPLHPAALRLSNGAKAAKEVLDKVPDGGT